MNYKSLLQIIKSMISHFKIRVNIQKIVCNTLSCHLYVKIKFQASIQFHELETQLQTHAGMKSQTNLLMLCYVHPFYDAKCIFV